MGGGHGRAGQRGTRDSIISHGGGSRLLGVGSLLELEKGGFRATVGVVTTHRWAESRGGWGNEARTVAPLATGDGSRLLVGRSEARRRNNRTRQNLDCWMVI
jgi:hypothetical protein